MKTKGKTRLSEHLNNEIFQKYIKKCQVVIIPC